MKSRFAILALAVILVASAPLIAYTIDLDSKSGIRLTQDQQEIFNGAKPRVRAEKEKQAIEKKKQKSLKDPRENVIYLNGKPREEWPK
ncbi:MAG: hypothetical protein ABFQ95_01460 [Pseudomonadota bacterium]